MGSAARYAWFTDEWYRVTKPDCAKAGCELCRPAKKRGRAFCYRRKRKVVVQASAAEREHAGAETRGYWERWYKWLGSVPADKEQASQQAQYKQHWLNRFVKRTPPQPMPFSHRRRRKT